MKGRAAPNRSRGNLWVGRGLAGLERRARETIARLRTGARERLRAPPRTASVGTVDPVGLDPMTGLPSRQRLLLTVHRLATGGGGRGGAGATVLAVEFDTRALVVSIGHEPTEEVVTQAAARLVLTCRDAVIGRFSADTLVLAYPGTGVDAACERASSVQRAFADPFEVHGHDVLLATAIGITDSSRSEVDELLHDAVAAARSARRDGGGAVELFESTMRTQALARLRRQSELRRAIDDGGICLHFQPIVLAEEGRVVAFEALARWRRSGEHGEEELLAPEAFIPLAEDTGLIRALGQHVLATACEAVAGWNELRGDRKLAVSVNLCAREIAAPGLADFVTAQIERAGINPGQLSLELTESALLRETPNVTASLSALRELGVWLILDDFGTGFASLSMLKRVVPRVVKLDRMFVAECDAVDESIVAATVQISARLGASVVAEGVETAAQLEQIKALGCHYVQGYLVAPPLDPARAAELARQGTVRDWGARAVASVD